MDCLSIFLFVEREREREREVFGGQENEWKSGCFFFQQEALSWNWIYYF